MTEEQRKNANRIRKELAAELSKDNPDRNAVERLRREIMKSGGRCVGRATC